MSSRNVQSLLAPELDLGCVDLKGKIVLLRVDLNVPIDGEGHITSFNRIEAILPTIHLLIEKGAKIILLSHLGRPKPDLQTLAEMQKYSLKPVSDALYEILGGDRFVGMVPDCIGPIVKERALTLEDGQVLLLENTRFYGGDLANDDDFAEKLAVVADVFVNDAFGVVHRDQASVSGVAKHVKVALPGPLLRKEIQCLTQVVDNPKRPFVVILGGAKVVDKIGIIRVLLEKADKILIGGKMAFSFLKANGVSVGSTSVDEIMMRDEDLREMQAEAGRRQVDFLLPIDQVVSPSLESGASTFVVPLTSSCCTEEKPCMASGLYGVDIGPATEELFASAMEDAATIFWNGPLGKFEVPEFAHGTLAVAGAIARATTRGVVTVMGGGDSVSAVEKAGLTDKNFIHVSTGGGASLELIQGFEMPGLLALL